MPRNKVYAIVEGHGEANPPSKDAQAAVTVLIARLLTDLGCWTLFPAKDQPWRMRSCGDFVVAEKLENTLRAHVIQHADCAAVLVLFDLDDGCPKDVTLELTARIQAMEPLPFSVIVVCALREYEGWFLASLESLHPGSVYPGDPESKRDAKGWLSREFGYQEVRDQARYTGAIDLTIARQRSRSFRRLYHAFEELVLAGETGATIITPKSV